MRRWRPSAQRLPRRTRFLGYGHRVSFAYVAGGVLSGCTPRKVAGQRRRGCRRLEPAGLPFAARHLCRARRRAAAEQFAELLAEELARREETEPRGELPVEIAAAIPRAAPSTKCAPPIRRHPALVQPGFDRLDGGV